MTVFDKLSEERFEELVYESRSNVYKVAGLNACRLEAAGPVDAEQ